MYIPLRRCAKIFRNFDEFTWISTVFAIGFDMGILWLILRALKFGRFQNLLDPGRESFVKAFDDDLIWKRLMRCNVTQHINKLLDKPLPSWPFCCSSCSTAFILFQYSSKVLRSTTDLLSWMSLYIKWTIFVSRRDILNFDLSNRALFCSIHLFISRLYLFFLPVVRVLLRYSRIGHIQLRLSAIRYKDYITKLPQYLPVWFCLWWESSKLRPQ